MAKNNKIETEQTALNRPHRKKLFTKGYWLMILTSLATAMGYSMVSTLISSYAVGLGAGLSMAGTVAGVFSMAALLSRPVGGLSCDLFNKRTICIVATAAICLCFAGYAYSANIATMILFRVLHGIAFGISGTANLALVSEIIPEERMGEGLGYFGLGQIMSQVCGPVIGVILKEQIGFRNLFLLIAALSALAIFVLLAYHYEPPALTQVQRQARTRISFRNLVAGECLVYALIAGMFSLANGVVSSFLVLVGEERGIPSISLFFTFNAAILFLVRMLMGKVADKSPLSLIVSLSLVMSAASMGVLAKAWVLPLVLVAAALKAFGQGAGQISLQSACIRRVDAARIGIATSTYYIGADLGNSVGPTLGGWISDSFGYAAMFYCVGALMLLSMLIFFFYQRRISRAQKDAVQA